MQALRLRLKKENLQDRAKSGCRKGQRSIRGIRLRTNLATFSASKLLLRPKHNITFNHNWQECSRNTRQHPLPSGLCDQKAPVISRKTDVAEIYTAGFPRIRLRTNLATSTVSTPTLFESSNSMATCHRDVQSKVSTESASGRTWQHQPCPLQLCVIPQLNGTSTPEFCTADFPRIPPQDKPGNGADISMCITVPLGKPQLQQ